MHTNLRFKLLSLLCALVLALCLPCAAAETAFAGGSGTPDDPWQIETAEQLAAISGDLTASYRLIADIDLSEYGPWTPIGAYVQDKSTDPDGEDPILEYAFTGTFDGGDHVISNLTIDQPEGMGVGLFACIAGEDAFARNLTLRDVHVSGMMMCAGLVGYVTSTADHAIDNVHLTASEGQRNAIEDTFVMAGGLVAGCTGASITNCSVERTDVVTGPFGIAGALGGGLSHPIFKDCSATDCTVAAESLMTGEVDGMGFVEGLYVGGLAGCVNSAREPVAGCTAENITVTVGGAGRLVGGFIGGGGSEATDEAPDPMAIENCAADVRVVVTGAGVTGVGGFIGGGMTDEDSGVVHSYAVSNCSVNGTISAEGLDPTANEIGLLMGRAYRSTVDDATVCDVTLIDGDCALIGVELN